MDPGRTQELLRSLHAELTGTDQVDDETLGLLKSLADDYHRLAGDDELAGQVKQLIQHIELDHPKLSSLVHQLTNTLANLGI